MPRWCLPHRPPTEASLVREATHYQKLLSRYRARTDPVGKRLWIAYRMQVAMRSQLIMALRDGRPHAWADYPARVSHPGTSRSALDYQRDVREGVRVLQWLTSFAADRRLGALTRVLRQHVAHKRELIVSLCGHRGDGQGNARV